MAAFMVSHFDVGDYDSWKEMFDSDPAGRKQAAEGHRIMRNVDNPSDVWIRLDFESLDEAKAFRERLLESGVLERITVKGGPEVVELADEAQY